MKTPDGVEWEALRRQVALCGRVTWAATGQPVDDAAVRIVDGPWRVDALAERKPNAIYFFLDLPAGRYVVEATRTRGTSRARGTGEVAWDDEGNIRRAVVDLELRESAGEAWPVAPARRPRKVRGR